MLLSPRLPALVVTHRRTPVPFPGQLLPPTPRRPPLPAQGHVFCDPLPSQQVFGRTEPATSVSDLRTQLHLKEAEIRTIRQDITAAEGQFERRRTAALVTRVAAAAAATVAAANLPLPPVAQPLLSATDMTRAKAQDRMAHAAALLAAPPLPGSHPTPPGPLALHEPYKDSPCTSVSPSLSPSLSSRTMPPSPGCISPGSPPLSEWAPLNCSVIVSPTTFVCTSMTPTLATQCGCYCVLTWPLASPSPTTA
jgi:hypothetical protein